MGVNGMKIMMNKIVLITVVCMKETWVWQTITAATVEGGVILFHLCDGEQNMQEHRAAAAATPESRRESDTEEDLQEWVR